MKIGTIMRVPLRDVWKHEATDFTCWLQEHLEVVNEATGLALEEAEREQNAGDFSVDLVAEDPQRGRVIIENQLERSDHDHLGKLVTYLAFFEAKVAVWIASEPRPEHVRAVAWLNESNSADVYLLKAEAIKIGDSHPALLLTRITGPSVETASAGATKKRLAGADASRHGFFEHLLLRAKQETKLHSGVSAGRANWIGTTAGLPYGLSLNYVVTKNGGGRAELYVDAPNDDGASSRLLFDRLHENREEVEARFGEELDWSPLENARACRIAARVAGGGWADEQTWTDLQQRMVNAMVRLEGALRPQWASLPDVRVLAVKRLVERTNIAEVTSELGG